MKILFYFLVFLTSACSIIAQTTPIPDGNFEQDLVNQGIDTNGLNGNILDVDAEAITSLTLGGSAIADITGIEAFINLIDLDLGNNPVANVDLSALTQLINFTTDKNDALTTIDFSQNLLLETVWMEGDFGVPGEAPITVIDLSNNVNLTTIDIDFLRNVTDLILPVTPTLTNIYLRYLSDISLDFSLLDGLEDLNIGGSTVGGVVITLPNVHTVLKDLRISSIDIPTIDISNYTNLESIYFWGTYVENLLLPTSTTLTDIFIILHDIQNPLDFSILPNLEDLDITSNQTTPLLVDVTQNLELTDIDLSSNDMYIIDLTQNVLLEDLRLDSNNFTSLDLTQNVNLESLSARYNQLPTLDLTQNVLLRYVYLSYNVLPDLDVTQNLDLRGLSIDHNLFTTTGLDLTQNGILNSLVASHNQIESLDISQNVDLTYLDISYNLFTGTSIMDQFYTVRLNDNGIHGGAFIANYNQLHGLVPDFASLVEQNNGTPIGFDLVIDNNNLEFGHFENQHSDLVIQDNTPGPAPSWTWMDNIEDYFYAPQAKVDTPITLNANAGDAITLTTICSGMQNHYAWYKDGVLIPDAPDSWEYTITDLTSCDEGIYYAEVTSDLIPFENTSPPGTGGKNLLLTRHDITLNITSPAESCVNLISPANGATNVALNEILEWTENEGACGYFLSVGTTPGGTDILNNFDVGNINSYNIGTNFPANTQIYVTITPYFQSGNVLPCTEESFTTGSTEQPTVCTALISGLAGATVPSYTNIEWLPSNWATGYFLTIGTTPGGNDVVNMLDMTNATVYDPPSDLVAGTTYYVTISPYNGLGTITGCTEEFFQIESDTVPCTNLSSPSDGDVDVALNSDLNWNPVTGATGYIINIGTTSGGTDIANNLDVGNITSYDPATDFPEFTEIFVTITPYDGIGNAIGCFEESFFTEVLPTTCTNLTMPLNGETDVAISSDISWSPVSNATGYILTVGTTSGGTDLLNNVDVGNITTYNPATDFPENTEIFVSVIPYNALGNAIGCTEESFVTEVLPTTCTSLTSPANGQVDVAVNSNLSWNAVSNASGYILNVGTTSGGSDIVNAEDVGNATTYNLSSDFPEDTEIFVTIIPYNALGNATGCTEESFTTEILPIGCTTMISPINAETDVAVETNIIWSAATNATGYLISIGTTSGGTDLVDTIDVGNSTIFNPTTDFPENTEIFVNIIPYNTIITANGCTEESFTTEVLPTTCTNLTSPLNGETDVIMSSDISWSPVSNATGYILTVGTTSGGTDLLNNVDVGNITTYNPVIDFPENTEIFVSIIPYNSLGNATGCAEENFVTEVLPTSCTALTSPANGQVDVAINSDLSWNAVSNASGYILNVGTTSGDSDIVNAEDVGNVTTYSTTADFPQGTDIFVTVIPYNSIGNATGCNEESFTTERLMPSCATMINPIANETDVAVDTDITWTASDNAIGYTIAIGTSIGSGDVVSTTDVGNVTSFNLPSDLPPNTQIFVTITAYNAFGFTANCGSDIFTTIAVPPNCTSLISPTNGFADVSVLTHIEWSPSTNAEGYYLSMGTSSGNYNLINTLDVGNITDYDYAGILPEGTEIFVLIVPYNTIGESIGCQEESFFTELNRPNCTTLISPANGQLNVAVNSNLQWNAIDFIDGYYLSIGTSSGSTDVLNGLDVGNATTYQPDFNFESNSTYYITIIPYNDAGEAVGCNESIFTTELLPPECTYLTFPYNGEDDVPIDSDIYWNSVDSATGYMISIGTTPNGNDIEDNYDVGDTTSYSSFLPFEDGSTIFVSITPYNDSGEAVSCEAESFTVENRSVTIPKFFTPNNDTKNDFWIITDPHNQVKRVVIFDRYGKLLKISTNVSDGWDGTFNGTELHTDDYWYQIEMVTGKTISGHFTLKR